MPDTPGRGDSASFEHRRWQAVVLLLCALTVGFVQASERADPVRIGVPPWQGAEVKSAVVAEILRQAGYEVEITSAAAPLVFQELAQGRLDFNLSAWVPGQDGAFGPHVEAGRIVVVGENLTGASTGLAVPEVLAPEGLRSLDDLADHAEELGRIIYCIEPGSGAMAVLDQAVDQDLYGLGEWRALASSTEGMLSQVQRSIRRGEPMLFCAWQPHWMNIAFDIRYLDDPLGHWGGAGDTRVLTLARHDLAADRPELLGFLERFRIDASTQSDWIHAYARDGQSLDAIARQWIDGNGGTIRGWWQTRAESD
ncbi:MAG: hypothetical protein GVY11_06815 [Gammaproteobacteria bacterium]|jgi:glycine betaine/proline transport system substrate-binding protein|nr:hypothetical protein [Gammaproteobacteria bacterium]